MDLNRIRYFLAVHDTGSVRKAAEILRLSPAALSKSIKGLEEELQTELLMPSGRGIRVTQKGRDLVQIVRPLVKDWDQVGPRLQQKTTSSMELRLGSFEVFTTHFLRGLIQGLSPHFSILLRELTPGDLERSLLSQEIDFGLTYLPIPTVGVEHVEVTQVQMGIFGLRDIMNGRRFEEWPFVIPVQPISGAPNKVQGLDGWPDGKIQRLVKYRVTLMESALEFCRMGKAVAYLPTVVVDFHNQSVKPKFQLSLMEAPKGLGLGRQGVYLVKRKQDPEEQVFKQLARAIRLACRN